MYGPDKFPIFIRHSAGMQYAISGFPSMDGGGVKVILDKFFGDYDADRLDRNIAYEELGLISDIVRDLMPGLNPNPSRVGVYMDGYTPDEHAIVGPRADSPDMIVLVGFSGHGFKMSPVMGQIAADLAVDGSTQHGIAHLSPQRMEYAGTPR
jgi:sarcosine oxidase